MEIFAYDDAFGPVSVREVDGVRSLYFETEARQSAIDLADPRALALQSTRRLAAALILAPPPRRALILGLGGGSLAKAIVEGFPGCEVDAVERRPLVVSVARRFFALPDDPRLAVLVGDAAEVVQALPADRRYELVFVDLYNGTGADAATRQVELFRACRARMVEGGVLAFNLWRHEAPAHLGPEGGLRRTFAPPHLSVLTPNGNLVCFAGSAGLPGLTPALLERARDVAARTGLDTELLLTELIHFNPEHFGVCGGPAAAGVADPGEQTRL